MKDIKQLIADFDRWTGKGNLIQANQTASRLFTAFAEKLGLNESDPEPETTKQLLTEPAPVAKTVLVEPAPVVATTAASTANTAATVATTATTTTPAAKKATGKTKGA